MKKLQKEFTANYDKVGNNKFIQIKKENGKMNVKMPLNKGSKFTISMLTTYTGIDTVYIRKAVKEWLNDGVISINGSVKNETGRGKPSIEYVVV